MLAEASERADEAAGGRQRPHEGRGLRGASRPIDGEAGVRAGAAKLLLMILHGLCQRGIGRARCARLRRRCGARLWRGRAIGTASDASLEAMVEWRLASGWTKPAGGLPGDPLGDGGDNGEVQGKGRSNA
jgi:hypothetical protein